MWVGCIVDPNAPMDDLYGVGGLVIVGHCRAVVDDSTRIWVDVIDQRSACIEAVLGFRALPSCTPTHVGDL